MDIYNQNFYDLLGGALGRADSSSLQAFIDATLRDKYDRLDLSGFEWDPDMQIDFTYEQVQQTLGITPMANYYDVDSPAKPFAGEGFSIATGKIPRMKNVAYFNEDKLRKQLIFDRLNVGNARDVVENRRLKLFTTVDNLFQAHANSLTYQRDQMISKGMVEITTANNPYGISGVTLYANVSDGNKTTLTGAARWWTAAGYATEGANANPILDLKEWVRGIRLSGAPAGHIEVNWAFFQRILSHSAVRAMLADVFFPLAGNSTVAANAVAAKPDSEIEAAFSRIIGSPVRTVDHKVAVEKYDATTRALTADPFDSFEPDVLVWVPDGTIGTVKSVMPLTVPDPAAAYGRFINGKGLLTVTYDASKKCQAYETELTALAVPTAPQRMYYFYPCVIA